MVLRIYTLVIANGSDVIILLFPPDIHSRILKRRQLPRFDVLLPGSIQSLTDPFHKKTKAFNVPVDINIINISQGGIGFTTIKLPLANQSLLSVEIQFEDPLLCTLEVLHGRENPAGMYFGTRFKELSPQQMNSLRAWMLRKQIDLRFEAKESQINDDAGEAKTKPLGEIGHS